MIHQLFEWLWAMLTHWQGWLSGGGLGGLALISLYLFERFSGRTVPKLWYSLIVFFFFFLGASFTAWRDQTEKTRDALSKLANANDRLAALTTPSFSGVVNWWMAAPGKDGVIITMEVRIVNKGAPSIASDFKMEMWTAGKMWDAFLVPPR